MVKHMQKISDEETIQMIRENVYIQYFLGFDTFTSKAPFDSSLFVEILKRMGMEQLNRINDVIYQVAMGNRDVVEVPSDADCGDENDEDLMSKRQDDLSNDTVDRNERSEEQPNRGRMLVDATARPQDIAYPTVIGLLNAGRMKCEEIIDRLYDSLLHGPVEAQNLSGESKEGLSEYGEEEEKDPRGAESRHRKATALCE